MNEIILAIIGSGALSTIVSAVVTALGNRKSKIKELEAKTRKIEKDSVRLQLLFMMNFQPDERKEIMTIGQYYFETLKSNWYMTSLFRKWLDKEGLETPVWFKGGNDD